MRQIRRLLLYILCCGSFLLGLMLFVLLIGGIADRTATPGLCMGLRRLDHWDSQRYHVFVGVAIGPGKIWYSKWIIPVGTNSEWCLSSHPQCEFVGFQIIRYYGTPTDWYYGFGLPAWFMVPLCVTTGVLTLRRLIGKWTPGTCKTCGYDLRASTGRCPECGTAFTTELLKSYEK